MTMQINKNGILQAITELYDTNAAEIEKWFAEKRAENPPHFYTSVDLRHSGLRLVPVDTNLFPAGFNNLSPAARTRAASYTASFFTKNYPNARRVLIIPESHTRNLAYFDNLFVLQSIITQAGMEVKIASLILDDKSEFTSALGEKITQHPIIKNQTKLSTVDGFVPDIIILNNDMTSGIPDILRDVAQPIIPPPKMGWFQRKKSIHFLEYQKLASDFGKKFSIDPWLLCANSHQCGIVDFRDQNSLSCLASAVDSVIASAKEKHLQYGIEQQPYVYIKADSGTYGMGIMTAHSGSEVMEINKKTRNKMQIIKEGARVSDVIVQEGIATIDTVGNAPAEPMIYLIDGTPTGGMYRINEQRDALSNLNAAGMRFTGMCDENEKTSTSTLEQWQRVKGCHFRAHGIVASIAALAASREIYNQ